VRLAVAALAITLAATVSACTSQVGPSPVLSSSGGGSTADCDALRALVTAAQGVDPLRLALSGSAPSSEILAKAEAVLAPIKGVLSDYSSSERSDPQAAAIRAASEDLADGAGFFETQQAPGSSAPPSGLGSRQWALGQLDSGVAAITTAGTLLRTQAAPGESICH
jgi:hypothetical protein